MSKQIDKTAQVLNLPLEAYAGQLDKAGKPYIRHLLVVVRKEVDDKGVLHDFTERDWKVDYSSLKALFR